MGWLLSLFLLAAASPAPVPRIAEVQAVAAEGTIDVSFRVEGMVDRVRLAEALSNGSPLTVRYHLELTRKRPNWFDSTLATTTVELVCSYNSITRDYLLNYRVDRRLLRSELYADVGELQKRLTAVTTEDLFRTTRNPRGLRVRVRAEIDTGYLLNLIPWKRSTNWRVARIRTGGSAR